MSKNLFTTKNENKKMLLIEELYDKGEFLLALKELEHYLILYPRDLKALFLEGKMFRMLKFFDDARESLIKLFPYIDNNKEYEIKVLVELIYLEIQERNYLSAYSYLERLQKVSNSSCMRSLNVELAQIYLKHQLGIEVIPSNNKKRNYFEDQILSYDEEEFLKRLFSNNGCSLQEDCFRRFSPLTDLEDLYGQIKNVISLAKVTPAYNVFDTYLFYYPNVGYDEEGTLDHVQVLAYSDVGGGGLYFRNISIPCSKI